MDYLHQQNVSVTTLKTFNHVSVAAEFCDANYRNAHYILTIEHIRYSRSLFYYVNINLK